MKINLLYIGAVALLLSACNPNEDFIDTLDSEVKPAGIDLPSSLTLESTYPSQEEARVEIPKYLGETYGANATNEGELIVVDYDVEVNKYLSETYTDKNVYELVDTDYTELSEQKYPNFSTAKAIKYIPFLLEDMYRKSGYELGEDKLVKYTFRGGADEYREYLFNGTNWTKTDKVNSGFDTEGFYKLLKEDYIAMGTEYGQPGSHNSFDGKMNIDEYIIAFLSTKYADAAANDIETIKYKYYGNRADQIIFTLGENGKWMKKGDVDFDWSKGDFKLTNLTELLQDKFIFKASAWELIVITAHTFTKADYALSGDEKYSNFGYYDDKAGEYPEGVAVDNILIAKLTIALNTIFPDAEEGDLFKITYNYYANSVTAEVSKRFIKQGDAFVEVVE